MNIDQNLLVSFATLNSRRNKRHKTAFFVINFIKVSQNYSFTKMLMKIWYICNLCVIWKYHPCDMYIHLHTIGFIGKTALGTVTFHFAPDRRRFYSSTFFDEYCCVAEIFSVKLWSRVFPICTFSAFTKYDITILMSIVHGNRPLTSKWFGTWSPLTVKCFDILLQTYCSIQHTCMSWLLHGGK